MKTMKSILIIFCLITPLISFSQAGTTRKSDAETTQKTYQKKTYRKTTRVGTSSADTIRKDNAPVLEDNGSVNTTGIVDGNRSSTGRPGADTLVNYSVKKSKKTTTTTKTNKRKQP